MSSGNPYKRVTTGQKLTIPAQAWNALMDGVEPKDAGGFNSGLFSNKPIPWIYCVNSSSAAVDQFGVMGIEGVAITESDNPDGFKSTVILNGTASTFSLYAGKFVIAAEPIAVGAIGRVFVNGVVPAYVNITDTSHKFADIKNSDPTQLQSTTSGSAQILWQESGTGSKWTVLNLGASAGGSGATNAAVLVYLTKTGGSDGDGTTAATWVYTVYSDAAKTISLATSQAPKFARVDASSNTPANYGLWDGTTLIDVDESYALDICADPFTGSTV